MNPTALTIEEDNGTVVSQIHSSSTSQSSKSTSLRDVVRATVMEYLVQWDNTTPVDLYKKIMAEIEVPLLEMVLQYTRSNQCKAAQYLNISRVNLRQKMKKYGFLNANGKKKS